MTRKRANQGIGVAVGEIGFRQSRVWEDVEVGEVLPALEFPITIKTLVLAAAGTRDFAPYHHDSAYSKSVGNPDMFVNTMFQQALFARCVTDWSGPDSDFRESTLKMATPLCPGDVAKVEGRVAEKWERDADHRITIALTASCEKGLAAMSTVTLAMPSRAAGPVVVPVTLLAKPVVPLHPETPSFAREWLGKQSPPAWGGYPVSEVQILYWCDMVEDANPLYVDGDYARKSRHGGVIAPPVSLITWGLTRAGHMGDVNCPARKPWPPIGEAQQPFIAQPPGARESLAQGTQQVYARALRPGDQVYVRSEILSCSPLKQTRVGPGYFLNQLDTYYNQHDEIVGTDLMSVLWYGFSG